MLQINPSIARLGVEIAAPRGCRLPSRSAKAWHEAAQSSDGLVFRAVRRGGHVRPSGLRGADIALIVEKALGQPDSMRRSFRHTRPHRCAHEFDN